MGEVFTALYAGSIRFSARSKGYFSAFSLSSQCRGVYESGLKYPLENATLSYHNPLGVSNEFIGQEAMISLKQGTLLALFSDEAELIDQRQRSMTHV
jgi:thiamine pyrophosphokinase